MNNQSDSGWFGSPKVKNAVNRMVSKAAIDSAAHIVGQIDSQDTAATSTKPATKGSRQTSFRAKVSDVAYRVCLVFYGDEGTRREESLYYLNASEWEDWWYAPS